MIIMKMQLFKFIAMGSILLLSTSCNRFYYLPPTKNVPLHDKQGDLRISGYMTYSEIDLGSSEIQASIAVTDNIGLMYNYMYANGGNSESKQGNYGFGHHHEFGIGYFGKIHQNLKWEVYGGYGYGYQFHHYYDSHKTIEVPTKEINHQRFLIQPTIAHEKKNFQLYAFAQIAYMQFDKNLGMDYPNGRQRTPANEYILSSFYAVEPGIGIRFGFRNIRFNLQQVVAVYSHNASAILPAGKFSIGMSLELNPFKDRLGRAENKLPDTNTNNDVDSMPPKPINLY